MTKNSYKSASERLPRRFFDGLGFSLSWNIYSEVVHGEHSTEDFEIKMRDGEPMESIRRYSEVLLEKGVKYGALINLMCRNLSSEDIGNERERLFYEEFSDWKLESKVARYKGVKRDFKKG